MRGYAVINVIYPLCSVLFSPIALILFDAFGMPIILIAYGVTTLIDAALESRIKVDFEFIKAKKTSLREYGQDLASAFRYLREDKAILAVYFAFTLIMLSDCSTSVLMYPYFNTNPALTNDHYALMLSIRSAGYLMGGLLHYIVKFLIINALALLSLSISASSYWKHRYTSCPLDSYALPVLYLAS